MHLDYDTAKSWRTGKMIFPRYHQLDAVTKLVKDAKENGSGKNYLIQHSAGSGKSNSIAWLAYRLSSLHDDNDNKIFDSVIVVTDRKVLDSQLQNTIYQFDHVPGTVVKIDKGKTSKDLLQAINDGKKIIITTLQKFPRIYTEINSVEKKFAVIVDEAHSSQTGASASKLKEGLGNTEEILEEYARNELAEEKVVKHADTMAQWADKAAGKINVGLVGKFLTEDIAIDYEGNKLTNVAKVGAKVTINGKEIEDYTEFVYDVNGDGSELWFRAVVTGVDYNATGAAGDISVVYVVEMTDGTKYESIAYTTTVAEVYAEACGNGMPAFGA